MPIFTFQSAEIIKIITNLRPLFNQLLQHRHFVLWTMALGLSLRLLFLLVFQPEPISDFADYQELAASIAAGDGYAVHGVPTAFRPVGWPALLAGFYAISGPSPLAGQLLTLLMGMGILWLGYLLGKRLSGREEVGRLVLLLLAIHPNGIAYGQLLSAEIPFLGLVLGGALCLWAGREKGRNLLLAGILFGLATLVKSQGLFLPLIFAGAFYLNGEAGRWRGWMKKLAVVYLFVGITLLPWLIRNHVVFDAFPVLVTNGSANLLVGNNPFAKGKYKWGDQEIAWYEAQAPQASGEIAQADKARKLAFQYIREHPGETLSRIPKKLWYTYAHDYEGLDWLRESCGGLAGWRHRLMQGFKGFGQILYLIISFFVLRFSFYQHISKSAHQHIHHPLIRKSTHLLIFYFSLITIMIFGDGRFHFPLMPFLFLCAAEQLIPSSWRGKPDAQAQA